MRLIDADAELKEAKELSGPQTGDGWDNWGVYALIERQPTIDAVTVVRCKDCKSLAKIMDEKSGAIHLECFRTWARVKPDDFCSYGERAEENEQCLPMPGNDFFGRRWRTSERE